MGSGAAAIKRAQLRAGGRVSPAEQLQRGGVAEYRGQPSSLSRGEWRRSSGARKRREEHEPGAHSPLRRAHTSADSLPPMILQLPMTTSADIGGRADG